MLRRLELVDMDAAFCEARGFALVQETDGAANEDA